MHSGGSCAINTSTISHVDDSTAIISHSNSKSVVEDDFVPEPSHDKATPSARNCVNLTDLNNDSAEPSGLSCSCNRAHPSGLNNERAAPPDLDNERAATSDLDDDRATMTSDLNHERAEPSDLNDELAEQSDLKDERAGTSELCDRTELSDECQTSSDSGLPESESEPEQDSIISNECGEQLSEEGDSGLGEKGQVYCEGNVDPKNPLGSVNVKSDEHCCENDAEYVKSEDAYSERRSVLPERVVPTAIENITA